MTAFVGIDLGTTFSVVATINKDGKPQAIPNAYGRFTNPSVVYLGPDGLVVGEEAKEKMSLGEQDVAAFFKREMGHPDYELEFQGQIYTPIDLSALVLKYLKQIAEDYLNDTVTDAVITVPAYFNNLQRTATIQAGEKAGLRVLSIINEPTAAALAYGLRPMSQEQTVMIYDLGGGTFDVSVVNITQTEYRVLGTDGDHFLGGKDWDDRIFNYLVGQFEQEFGFSPADEDYHALVLKSEEVKKSLSNRQAVDVRVQAGGKSAVYNITREMFEEISLDLMERTQRLCEQCLQAIGYSWTKLDHVVLVGGSTRMPMVSNWVEKMIGHQPLTTINPDEAVALGAAMYAAESVNAPVLGLGPRKRTSDVISHSLGMIAVSEDQSKYINTIIIPKNQPVPISKTRAYQLEIFPWDDEPKLEVYVTQGETDKPDDCTYLGRYVFSGIPETDKDFATIEVTYEFDKNGVVHAAAVDQATRQPLAIRVEKLPDDVPYRFSLAPEDTSIPQPYNPSAGKQEIAGALRDRYGNARGNEFDLAKDGAFRGALIAVLHLYTSEGFDFRLPSQALEEKGFEVHRWVRAPSMSEFREVLNRACQLWVISNSSILLSNDHRKVIKEFFESGRGLYLWGDNEPYYADVNLISQLIFNTRMSGNTMGNKTLTIREEGDKVGLSRHLLTTGIAHLFEGITIATIHPTRDMQPLIYGSDRNLVAAYYDKDGKRAILDGGFTRLFCNWDTAGTARYVKNAAVWLANYERFGKKLFRR